jgi:flagellar hook-associated protein 2
VQSFITAYNTLLGVFDTLTAAGDHTRPRAPTARRSEDAAFYNDAGVRNLRDRLAALRSATGGQSLINFGISASQGWHADAGHQSSERTIAANPGSSTPCSAAPASASTAACWAR